MTPKMKYRLRDDVPVPSRGRARYSRWDIPISELRVGEMIDVTCTREEALKEVDTVRSYLKRRRRRFAREQIPKETFTVRLTEHGFGIWRLK